VVCMEEEQGFITPGRFPSPRQEQVLDEILHSAGQLTEEEIRARLSRAGFKRHHADDVVTAVEWLQDDLFSLGDAMRWRPESDRYIFVRLKLMTGRSACLLIYLPQALLTHCACRSPSPCHCQGPGVCRDRPV
jgi:hypothetical protein